MKMDADEKELLESVERGEWKSAKGGKRERARYSRYAKATFRKDRRLNIRLSFEANSRLFLLHKWAPEESVNYWNRDTCQGSPQGIGGRHDLCPHKRNWPDPQVLAPTSVLLASSRM